MTYYVTKEQMKKCEQYAAMRGIAPLTLMDNAGTTAVRVIRERLGVSGKNIVVVCGHGNNGGDGFVAARKLCEGGAAVTMLLTAGKPNTPDATLMFNRAVSMAVPAVDAVSHPDEAVRVIARAGLIIDAVYGTGFHPPLAPTDKWLFGEINRRNIPVASLDMPSGADSDSGECDPDCIKASLTVAFQYQKRGHKCGAGNVCGKIVTVEIGIPREAAASLNGVLCSYDKEDITNFFKKRDENSHKGTFGRALLFCGSEGMTGAAAFAAGSCLRSGAGLCELAVPDKIYPIIASRISEPVYTILKNYENIAISDTLDLVGKRLKTASACLIGCGLSTSDKAEKLTRFVLKNAACPLVIDADGINNLASHINELKEANEDVIITPHPGEMARLCGKTIDEINADRINIAADFSRKYGVFTVLKGHETVTACPDGRCFINTTGNAGMATGGSGDVLAGIIVSLLAQGFEPCYAAMCGVWIHGAAGDLAAKKLSQISMLPTDIINSLPLIFSDLERI